MLDVNVVLFSVLRKTIWEGDKADSVSRVQSPNDSLHGHCSLRASARSGSGHWAGPGCRYTSHWNCVHVLCHCRRDEGRSDD